MLAEVSGGGGSGAPVSSLTTEPSALSSVPHEEVDENRRPFRVARVVLDAWADEAHDERDQTQPGAWGGPEGALCRLLERAGPWRAASVLTCVWQRVNGLGANVWLHERSGDQSRPRTGHGPRRGGRRGRRCPALWAAEVGVNISRSGVTMPGSGVRALRMGGQGRCRSRTCKGQVCKPLVSINTKLVVRFAACSWSYVLCRQ